MSKQPIDQLNDPQPGAATHRVVIVDDMCTVLCEDPLFEGSRKECIEFLLRAADSSDPDDEFKLNVAQVKALSKGVLDIQAIADGRMADWSLEGLRAIA